MSSKSAGEAVRILEQRREEELEPKVDMNLKGLALLRHYKAVSEMKKKLED